MSKSLDPAARTAAVTDTFNFLFDRGITLADVSTILTAAAARTMAMRVVGRFVTLRETDAALDAMRAIVHYAVSRGLIAAAGEAANDD